LVEAEFCDKEAVKLNTIPKQRLTVSLVNLVLVVRTGLLLVLLWQLRSLLVTLMIAVVIAEFAVGLGAIAGLTNLIPFFGPILGAVPALIVAIAQGGLTFFWVLLLFLIIQNVETYVLDPLLVGSSVKVHSLYQLLAVLGGTQVLGIIGALIVPPWVAGAAVLLENPYLKPKLLAEQQEEAIAPHSTVETSNTLPVNP
jgi:predicted PurR-regulated permease PerM